MFVRNGLSRRGFVGGVASALGYLSFKSPLELFAQGRGLAPGQQQPRPRATEAEYDLYAKLSSNENPYGPLPRAAEAMRNALASGNRYAFRQTSELSDKIASYCTCTREQVWGSSTFSTTLIRETCRTTLLARGSVDSSTRRGVNTAANLFWSFDDETLFPVDCFVSP